MTPAFVVGNIPIYGDLILAPLAGYSDPPYRSICRRMGSAMSYTEFASVNGLLHDNQKTWDLLQFDPQERPVVFQVFGSEPEAIVKACQRIQELGPDIIDINMGCPASRISKHGGGAGLLREPAKIARIFDKLSSQLSIPVTGKIRLGWDQQSRNYLEIARILEDNGASLIAVHGRTREDNYKIPADWDAIAEVKSSVHIPVIGNGDVKTVADIERIKAHTGCDGIMIGRAAIGNPWILARKDQSEIPIEERIGLVREHLQRMADHYGETRGVLAFRKHIVRYIRGLPNAAQVRSQLMKCTTCSQVLEQLAVFTSHSERVIISTLD